MKAVPVNVTLQFIGGQNHDDVGRLGRNDRIHDYKSGSLRLGGARRAIAKGNDNVFDTAVAHVQRVGVLICPLLSSPKTMIVWTTKGTMNAEQEAQAGRDYRQAA
ncbi:hypothetical protein SAMN05518849_13432 [Sphingobium sp. AP50]|nr:hypothetical protein SAMN05518849_13432 [Sphingobium sp. AP50]